MPSDPKRLLNFRPFHWSLPAPTWQPVIMLVVSITLTFLAWVTADGINPDGILYVETADAFRLGGYPSASRLYDWPFFSILIGLIADLLEISAFGSAQLLGMTLMAFLSLSFLSICKHVYPDPAAGWLAIVLLAAILGLNEYRAYVIRDFGFWTFTLGGTLALIHVFKQGHWAWAVCWQLMMTCALAFRIEAIAYMIWAPFCLFLSTQSWQTRVVAYLKCNCGFLVAILVFFLVWGDMFFYWVSDSKLKDILVYTQFNFDPVHVLNMRGRAFYDEIPAQILSIGLAGVVLIKTFGKLGLFSVFVAGYAVFSRKRIPADESIKVIVWLIPLALLIPYCAALHSPHMQGRFVIPLALLVSLLLVSPLYGIAENVQYHAVKKSLVALLLLLTVGDAFIHTGTSKKHLLVAAKWFRTEVPVSAKLLSNDPRLYFYSGRAAFQNGESTAKAEKFSQHLSHIDEFDYLLIREKGEPINQVEIMRTAGKLDKIKTFKGDKEGRQVTAYRVIR